MIIIRHIVIVFVFLLTGCKTVEVPIDSLQMTKISSSEYLITRDDLSMEFGIFVLVENEIVETRENFSIYKDMEKYILVNDLVDMKSYSLGFTDIIEVTINDNEKLYYEIYLTKDNSDVIELKYDFKNIEEEMKHLGRLLEKYPPIKEPNKYFENTFTILENEGIELEDIDSRLLYKEYLRNISFKTNSLEYSNFNERIVKPILLDGSNENYGSIIHSSSTNYNGHVYYDSKLMFTPFKINGCDGIYDYYQRSLNPIKKEPEITYYRSCMYANGKTCEFRKYSIETLLFDLSEVEIDSIDELNIEIEVGIEGQELSKVNSDQILLVNDYLYVYPMFTQKQAENNSGNYDLIIVIDVKIYKDDELIFAVHQLESNAG